MGTQPGVTLFTTAPPWLHLLKLTALLVGGGGVGMVSPLVAQAPPPAHAGSTDVDGWNSSAVLALIAQGRAARSTFIDDGHLESYRALTEGHIYFFVDPEVGERSLIRVDQVAVELRWAAPNHFQQHLLGERTETRLPVQDFRYYLDRLTLVQYGLGDEIQVGMGMDVAGVPHPLAPMPEDRPEQEPYDFRLADSISLSLPDRAEPLRLYDIEVRPRDPSEPGAIGMLTLDRDSHSLVRMALTFTPASYVDPRTDRISVELDYGLWEERYWLPNLQRIEVRREIPELDIGVGTVIRSVLRVGAYDMNVALPEGFTALPSVTAEPEGQRRTYAFREGLYDGMDRDGMVDVVTDPDLGRLRAEAIEHLEHRPPSGLAPLRLYLPRISDVVRYNRAEGFFLGGGASLRRDSGLRARMQAGFAFGSRTAPATLELDQLVRRRWTLGLRGWYHSLEDLGLAPGAAPFLASFAAATRGEDYQDPYLSSGGRLRLSVGSDDGDTTIALAIGAETLRTPDQAADRAPWNRSRTFRDLRPVAEGTYLSAGLSGRRLGSAPGGGRARTETRLEFRHGQPGKGVGLALDSSVRWGPASGTRELHLHSRGWRWWGDPLPQGHRLVGGRGTLPGFPFRTYLGTSVLQSSLVASTDVSGPFLRLRGGVHAAWTDGSRADTADSWNATATEGTRVSATLGTGVLWDLLRLDLARGLNGGEWQLLLSVDPGWWDRL